jgi:hypothetical protein
MVHDAVVHRDGAIAHLQLVVALLRDALVDAAAARCIRSLISRDVGDGDLDAVARLEHLLVLALHLRLQQHHEALGRDVEHLDGWLDVHAGLRGRGAAASPLMNTREASSGVAPDFQRFELGSCGRRGGVLGGR